MWISSVLAKRCALWQGKRRKCSSVSQPLSALGPEICRVSARSNIPLETWRTFIQSCRVRPDCISFSRKSPEALNADFKLFGVQNKKVKQRLKSSSYSLGFLTVSSEQERKIFLWCFFAASEHMGKRMRGSWTHTSHVNAAMCLVRTTTALPLLCHLHHQHHPDCERERGGKAAGYNPLLFNYLAGLTGKGGNPATHVENKDSYGDFTLIPLC